MTQPGLVERDRELKELARVVAEALDGPDGRVASIEGPAGIGKTRLLAEVRRLAAPARASVLTARGSELERDFPYGAVRQLFEARLADPAERERLLAGAAASAAPVFGGVEHGDHADASFATLHGLYWLAVDLAQEAPLVLAIDDLQWCDRPSLRFFAYLVRRLEGLPVLVATTVRTTEPGTDPALLAEISGDPATVAVRPGPLSPEAVVELVRDRLGAGAEPGFTAAVHRASGGNPLLLRQLLTAFEAEGIAPIAARADAVRDVGPRAVSRTILLRLARLPAEARDVAHAVAVLGDGADLAHIAMLAGLTEEQVASASGELARAEILKPDPPLGFVHPLVRAAVYQDLPPGERELRHARAARTLLDAGAASDAIATHLLAMPPRGAGWVVDVLRDAARRASGQGAPESAVTYLGRALAEPPPAEQVPDVQFALGEAAALVSGADALEPLRAAYTALVHDPARRAVSAFRLVQTTCFAGGSAEDARRLAREAQADLAGVASDDDLVRLEAMELMCSFMGARTDEAIERLRAYRTRTFPREPGAKMLQACVAWGWAVSGEGDVEECCALARDALADDLLFDHDEAWLTMGAAGALLIADRDEVLDVWDRLRERSRRKGSLFGVLGFNLWMGYTLLRRGDLPEAERLIRQSMDELQLWAPTGIGDPYARAWLARCRLEHGDVRGAREVLGPMMPASSTADVASLLLHSEVEVCLAEGRPDAALAAVEQLEVATGWQRNPAYFPVPALRAQVLDALGRTDEAVVEATRQVELAERWGAPSALGMTLRVLGTLKRDDGIADLERACDLLDRSAAKLQHAKALLALGAALRRSRRPTDAREPLRQALDLAGACGAGLVQEQARSELAAAGARPRATALAGVGSLTASERRVADLAASGQSNRDIAQALFVTPKTVEVHLSATYRKLGIRSRRDLAGALGVTP